MGKRRPLRQSKHVLIQACYIHATRYYVIAVLLVICSVILVASGLSADLSKCPGPVSFNSTSFTIRGPCPNNTVLAAVGSTVHYRCDYEDRTTDTNLPYWHIQGLTGTPFIQGDGMNHSITIASNTGDSVDTVLSIPVKEQYLNNTLNIQCGLCSGPVCYGGGDRLSENIMSSTSVRLATFGPPRDLISSTNSSSGTVSLYWTPPIVSPDYNCTVMDSISTLQQCWEYEVELISIYNQSQTITFSTGTDTQLEGISRLNITSVGFDTCGIYYSWNITAIAITSGHSSETRGQTELLLHNAPNISGNANYDLKASCYGNTSLAANFNVTAIQPLNTLDYFLVLNTSFEIYEFTGQNISLITTDSSDQVILTVQFPYGWIYDSAAIYVAIGVANECGMASIDQYELLVENVMTCATSTASLPTTIASSIAANTLSANLRTDMSFNSSKTITSITPSTTSPSDSPISNGGLLIIIIPVAAFIIIAILVSVSVLLICIAAVCLKKSNKKTFDINNDGVQLTDGGSSINTIDGNPAYSRSPYTDKSGTTASDYLTPHDAQVAYKSTIKETSNAFMSSSEAQYCEPAQLLLHTPSPVPPPSAHSPATTPTTHGGQMKLEEMHEVPGYCVPPPIERSSTKTKKNTLPREKKTVCPPTMAPPLAPDTAPPLYADINEIKTNKKLNKDSYASLNLSSSDQPPPLPPLHLPSVTYSTIESSSGVSPDKS